MNADHIALSLLWVLMLTAFLIPYINNILYKNKHKGYDMQTYSKDERYTLKSMENSKWVRAEKAGELLGIVMNAQAAYQLIYRDIEKEIEFNLANNIDDGRALEVISSIDFTKL
jgi:hypothetical protein